MPFGFIPDSAFGFAGIPIMMTGYSDKVRVEEARDVGVTEFLAKPFTAQDLYARIEKLIEKPRRFVEAEAFFGPERRRRKMKAEEYKGPKRRDAEPAGEPGPQRRDDDKPDQGSADVWLVDLRQQVRNLRGEADGEEQEAGAEEE